MRISVQLKEAEVKESTKVLVTKGTTRLMTVLNKERTIAKIAILIGHFKLFSN